MFKKIIYEGRDESAGRIAFNYTLVDDDFVTECGTGWINEDMLVGRGKGSPIIQALIQTYESYNRNVPKNLAWFYHFTSGHNTRVGAGLPYMLDLIKADFQLLEKMDPFSNYNYAKYANCVTNQVKLIYWVNPLFKIPASTETPLV